MHGVFRFEARDAIRKVQVGCRWTCTEERVGENKQSRGGDKEQGDKAQGANGTGGSDSPPDARRPEIDSTRAPTLSK